MENQTPFDLNQHIQGWRDHLSLSPAVCGENLNELESHLRDSMSVLQGRGLSAEEAFIVATKRVGAGGLLAAEFGKVNRQAVWIDRLLWMLVGVQLWGMVHGTMGGLAMAASTLALASRSSDATASLVFPIIALTLGRVLALAGSLALCWWLMMQKGPHIEAWIRRLLARRFSRLAQCGLAVAAVIGLLLPYEINALMNILVMKMAAIESIRWHEALMAQSYSGWVMMIFQAVGLLIITIILARKRLRLTPASAVV